MDGVRDKLVSEKAVSVGLKTELEAAAQKVQTIIVDVMLGVKAKLMGEFKRGEHSSWDPDEEIQTWDKRAAVLASGEASEDEDEEEEQALVVEDPKQTEGVDPLSVEPDVGAIEVAPEIG